MYKISSGIQVSLDLSCPTVGLTTFDVLILTSCYLQIVVLILLHAFVSNILYIIMVSIYSNEILLLYV